MSYFEVRFHTGARLHSYEEPDEFVSEHHGVIRYCSDDGRRSHQVGKLCAYRLHAGQALNEGVRLFDICDAHSQMMHDLYAALFNPGENSFRESVVDRFYAVELDVLVIDYLVLHPKWRGLRLGLLALRRTIDLLGGGCALAVCEPAPLNPDSPLGQSVPSGWVPRHEARESAQAACKRLRRYVRRMGFERIDRTPLYGLSMARVTPTVEELLRPSLRTGRHEPRER